jgi:hypothetical protein
MMDLVVPLAVIVGIIWALVVLPSFRIVALILVALGAIVYFLASEKAARDQKQEQAQKEQACRKARTEAEAEVKRWKIVAPSQVQLVNSRVERDEDGIGVTNYLVGSIRNNTAVPISAVELNVALNDCPSNTTPVTACSFVGQTSTTLSDFRSIAALTPDKYGTDDDPLMRKSYGPKDNLPPGQVWAFRENVHFKEGHTSRSVARWKVIVSKVRAPLDESDKLSFDDGYFAKLESPDNCR